jgi:hypothetical protein
VRSLAYLGTENGIALYAEDGEFDIDAPEGLWAEVWRDDTEFRDGRSRKRPLPVFEISVYRGSTLLMPQFPYRPRSPVSGELPVQVVRNIIRTRLRRGAA